MGGPRVAPELGAKVDVGEGPFGGKLDGMILVGTKGGDEIVGVVVKGVPQRDVLKEVT
jgi:hypothetical protein